MDIIISNASGKPIYEQITVQIKSQILSGALTAGDALPSMRLLAKELRISVITTKRAYEDLERDGFVVTVPGKGSFVAAQNVELLQTLYEEYQGALRYTATRIGVNSDDVDDVIQDSFCAFIKAYGDTIDQWEIARQKARS